MTFSNITYMDIVNANNINSLLENGFPFWDKPWYKNFANSKKFFLLIQTIVSV